MSDTLNRSNARKERQSDSKVDVRKSAGSKTEDALFALAAGAMGLGIALLKQEQAHAAVQNGDSALDQTSNLSDGSIDGQSIPPELLATEMSATPAQIVDAAVHSQNPEAATVTRLADGVPVPASPENIVASKEADSAEKAGQSSTAGETTASAANADPENVQEGLSASDDTLNAVGENVSGVLGNDTGLLSGVGETIDGTLEAVDELLASVLGVDGDEGGLLGGVGDTLDGTLDAVGDLATGLLGGGDNGGPLSGAGDTLDGTLDAVGDVVTGLLGGDDDNSGLLGGVGDTLNGALDTVGDVATGPLDGGGDNGGPLSGPGDTVGGTLDTVGNLSTGLLGGLSSDGASTTTAGDADVSSLNSDDPPSLLDAVNQALSLTDGGADSTLSFIGQPVLDSDAQHDADNPHGNLLHMLT